MMANLEDAPAPETLKAKINWNELRNERDHLRTTKIAKDRVGSVLHFLGLTYDSELQFKNEKAYPSSRNAHWVRYTFEQDPWSIGEVRGSPQFGSQTNGTFHIFCLWEKLDLIKLIEKGREIRNLAENRGNAVIVLYFGELTQADRQDIKRTSWTYGLTVAILDEVLLEVLARFHGTSSDGNRFQCFLAASLPYSAANPYNVTASWGASVSSEMFYGRRELDLGIKEMRGGTSLVFGGRQLGKTALLRNVEKTFTDPKADHFAWFIDLKDSGYVPVSDPANAKDPADILKIIHGKFTSESILNNDARDGNANQIRDNILNAFKQKSQLQVLVLFDESDIFLQLDSEGGSKALERMRVLMQDTNNRFKVVFAGLHSVQRFAHSPNNPFPNLGFDPNRPRRGGIGPLPDHEARQLVEQPFNLLGFRFQSLAVEKILSYTNRHPSLIQFFCYELVNTWRSNNMDRQPPFEVSIDDVDRVYRSRIVQDGIKMRFEETFNLEPRYHVISLTMILFQDKPTQKWSLEDIRYCCEDTRPIEFAKEKLPDLDLRSLLDELIGLGVLAEDGDSYRMRSPLLAQLFGNTADIEGKLKELRSDELFDKSTNRTGSGEIDAS